MKTTLDGIDELSTLQHSESAARDTFFRCSGKESIGGPLQDWKNYFTMVSKQPGGLLPQHFPITGPGRRCQASYRSGRPYVRDCGRFFSIDSTNRLRFYRLHLRLEHAAHRPGAVAGGLDSYIAYPPLQDPGELRSRPGGTTIKQAQELAVAATIANVELRFQNKAWAAHSPPAQPTIRIRQATPRHVLAQLKKTGNRND